MVRRTSRLPAHLFENFFPDGGIGRLIHRYGLRDQTPFLKKPNQSAVANWSKETINSRSRMRRIDPPHLFRRLGRGNIQIYHDRFLVAADDDAHHGLVTPGVGLLMRHKRRHVNKIAGAGIGDLTVHPNAFWLHR